MGLIIGPSINGQTFMVEPSYYHFNNISRINFSNGQIDIKTKNGISFYRRRGRDHWYRKGGSGSGVSKQRMVADYGMRFSDLALIEDCVQAFDIEIDRIIDRVKERCGLYSEEFQAGYADGKKEGWAEYSISRHKILEIWRQKNICTDDIPVALKSIRHIKRMDVILPCHIYFLLKSGQINYIGQTKAPWPQRIITHKKENRIPFDDVWYLEVDAHSLSVAERQMINNFNPPYNKI